MIENIIQTNNAEEKYCFFLTLRILYFTEVLNSTSIRRTKQKGIIRK
jgi:hypothetical protein